MGELSANAKETERNLKRMVAQLAMDPSSMKGKRRTNSRRSRRTGHGMEELASVEDYEAMLRAQTRISKEIFTDWLSIPHFIDLLNASDIDTTTRNDLFDILDADMGGSLGLDEVVTGLMKLRGPVSKNDIIAIRLKVRHMVQNIPLTEQEC